MTFSGSPSIDNNVRQVTADLNVHSHRLCIDLMVPSLDISHYTLKKLINHKTCNDVTAGYIITSPERLRQATDLIEKKMVQNF